MTIWDMTANGAQAVTPSDSTDLPGGTCWQLIIGTGGTLKITDSAGNTETLTVPAGRLPVKAKRVWSTGTSATGITALYI